MVVRLIGDGSAYFKMLNEAGKHTAKAEGVMKGLAKTAEQTGKRITQAGTRIRSAGRLMVLGLTTTLIALNAAAIKTGSDFESGFAGVRKTVDATEEQFAELNEGFKEMARRIPVATDELLKMGESAGQLGIKTKNILGFTETMAMLTASTNLTADEGAADMARFASIMDMPQEQFSNLGSSMVALGNNFATTERDILEMSKRLAGAGKVMGLTPAQVTGVATALSALGMEAEAGGSSMSQFMLRTTQAVSKGGKKLEGLAKTAGMSADEFKAAWEKDTLGTVQTLVQALGKLDKTARVKALNEMGIDGIRMSDQFLRLSNNTQMLTDAVNLSEKAFAENTALAKEAQQRFETFGSQVILLKNQIKDLMVEAFEIMRPSLIALIDKLKEGIAWVKSWSPESKAMAINIMKLAAVIGPLIAGLGSLTIALGAVISAGSVVAFTIAGITIPVWAVVAAIAALVAAIGGAVYWLIGPQGFADAWGIVLARMQNFVVASAGFMQNYMTNMRIVKAWVLDNWDTLFKDMGAVIGAFIGNGIQNFVVFVRTITRIVAVLAGWLYGVWERAWSIDFLYWIVEGIKKAADLFAGFFTKLWEGLKAAFTGKQLDFSDFISKLEGDFKKGAEDLNPLDAIMGVVNEEMANIKSPVSGLPVDTTLPEFVYGNAQEAARNPLADQSVVGALATPLQASLQPGSPQMQAVDKFKAMAREKTEMTLEEISGGIGRLVEIGEQQLKNPTVELEYAGLR